MKKMFCLELSDPQDFTQESNSQSSVYQEHICPVFFVPITSPFLRQCMTHSDIQRVVDALRVGHL